MVESWLRAPGLVLDGAARTLSLGAGVGGWSGSLVCGSLRMASRAPLTAGWPPRWRPRTLRRCSCCSGGSRLVVSPGLRWHRRFRLVDVSWSTSRCLAAGVSALSRCALGGRSCRRPAALGCAAGSGRGRRDHWVRVDVDWPVIVVGGAATSCRHRRRLLGCRRRWGQRRGVVVVVSANRAELGAGASTSTPGPVAVDVVKPLLGVGRRCAHGR